MSRYKNREFGTNDHEIYEDHFEARGVSQIQHYATPILKYPTEFEQQLISFVGHVWSLQDKYYLLAARYYNDPKLWWIIAQFNQAPTEQHLSEGQMIKIPYPLGAAYNYIGQE